MYINEDAPQRLPDSLTISFDSFSMLLRILTPRLYGKIMTIFLNDISPTPPKKEEGDGNPLDIQVC